MTLNKLKQFIFIFLILLASVHSAHTQMSNENLEAMEKTKNLLKNKAQRDVVIQNSPDSHEYINKMNQMGMNNNQQNQVFNISADLFEQLLKANNGDAALVQKILLNAQKDPESFYKSINPENKRMIQNLSTEVESIMNGKPPF